jgi:hypothetical protein
LPASGSSPLGLLAAAPPDCATTTGFRSVASQIPLRTLPGLLKEKIPLFLIAVLDAIITLHTERPLENWSYPLPIRLANAILSYGIYIAKAFWPRGLAMMYIHPGHALPWGKVAVATLLLIAVTVLALAAPASWIPGRGLAVVSYRDAAYDRLGAD